MRSAVSRSSAAWSASARMTSSSASGRSASSTASASAASAAMLSCSAASRARLGRGRGLDGRPPAARVDQVDREPGLPLEPERLLERAQAAVPCAARPSGTPSRLSRCSSRLRSRSLGLRRSSVISLTLRLGLEPQPPLQARDVLLERDHRRVGRAPRRAAWPTTSSRADELERHVGAVAEHRAGRVEQLVEAGQRPARGRRRARPPAASRRRPAPRTRRALRRAAAARRAPSQRATGMLGGVEELVVPGRASRRRRRSRSRARAARRSTAPTSPRP